MVTNCDVAVIGAGGAGLSASIFSRKRGLSVTVFEASAKVGGTYAYSTGLTWAPCTKKAWHEGYVDSVDNAVAHVEHLSAGHHDPAITRAFMEAVGPAVDELAEDAGVPYDVISKYPDYYSESPGGTGAGRYIASPVFDTRTLPQKWAAALLRSPIYERTPTSWVEVQKWGGYGTVDRWDHDLLAQRRDDGWVGFGTATTGWLLSSALGAGAQIEFERRMVGLVRDPEGWLLTFETPEGRVERRARNVVLATGAYDWNPRMQHMFDPHPVASPAGMPTVDGEAITLALEAGASFAPVKGEILVPAINIPGETFNDRPLWRLFVREAAFPGSLIVNDAGVRFADESFYHAIVAGINYIDPKTQQYPNRNAFYIFDQAWKDKYWLGTVAPGEVPDWMIRADSPEKMAEKLGIDAQTLAATIARFNEHAVAGTDPDFNRGSMVYARNNGDRDVTPNPNLRALTGTMYALPVSLSTLGGRGGLRYDVNSQVVDWRDRPIPGLYCTGNAGAALVEGYWYNSGIANARAKAFSWLASRHIAGMSSR